MALVGDHIATLKPYEAGKPIEELERELGITGAIKLASNENPLGPSPAATAAVQAAIGGGHIYPDAGAYYLREAIAAKHGIGLDEILVGNGSNELLNMVARTFAEPGHKAVISDYSFIAYRIVTRAANIDVVSVPTRPGFEQDLDAMAAAVDEDTKLVFLANPNNPTGTYANAADLERFLHAVPDHVVVVIDEAYVEYAKSDDFRSAIHFRDAHENLVVCRTFSKCFGLAGYRVGYAVTTPGLANYVNRIREPFNTNLFGQIAATAALGDEAFIHKSSEVNEASRAILESGLADLEPFGVRWTPSQTNFLLIETPVAGLKVYDAMLRQGVIVRPLMPYQLPMHLRITLGVPEDTRRCLETLGRVLREAQ